MLKQNLLSKFVLLCAVLLAGAGTAWADDYQKYSGTITEGEYLIVYSGKAMNNTVSSNRLGYGAVSPSGDVISDPDASLVWTVAASGDYFTLYNAAAKKYAASTGTKNQAGLLDSGSDDKALWTVSGTSTYEFVNKKNKASNVNANLRNNGTYGFACYATSTGGALTLYKKVDDGRTEIAAIGDLTPTKVNIGDLDNFNLTITPAVNTLVEGTDYIVVWETSDASILELSDETYEAKAKGSVTVTVTVTPDDETTYKEVSKEFTVKVVDPNDNDGSLEKPYTANEAYDIIKAFTSSSATTESFYVKGIVTRFIATGVSTDDYHRYCISSDGTDTKEVLVYNGKGLNNEDFTSDEDVQVGDEVVVYGKFQLYNTTAEITAGNYIYSLKRKAAPGLSFGDVTAFNVYPNEDFTAPTLVNPNNLTVVYSSTDEEVALVDENDGTVVIGNKEGTTTIKATFAGNDDFKAGEASYTITTARKDAGFSFSENSVTLKKGDAFEAPTFNNPNNLTGIVFKSSNNDVATVSNAGVIALGTATGVAVITATYAQTNEYRAGEATVTITVNEGDPYVEPVAESKYVKITSTEDLTAGKYLIVNENKKMAFNSGLASSSLSSSKNYITVTISSNEINATDATNAAAVTIDPTAGTIKTASGYYIGRGDNSNGMDISDSEEYENTISFDANGNAVIKGSGDIKLQLLNSSGSETFKYYKSSQLVIQLYKYVAGASETEIPIQISSAGFATYASNFDLDFSSVDGLFAYKAQMSGDQISFTKVDQVPAGEGVLLRAENGGSFNVPVAASKPATLTGNIFVRGTGDVVASEADGKKNYILNIVDNKIGFYRAAGQTVATNRAYLSTTVSAARIALSFDDETTGIESMSNAQSTLTNEVFDLQGRRVTQPTKGLYIVNGKKVVVK